MKGRLLIDNRDAYAQYGVYVVSGGWNELVALPPLKSPVFNDWQEEHGIEPDLSSPALDTRTIKLQMACRDADENLSLFHAALTTGVYHNFDCRSINRYHRLRLVELGEISYEENLAFFSVSLADDYPLDVLTATSPNSTLPEDHSILLDGHPISDWGLRLLKGTAAAIIAPPRPKLTLIRSSSTTHGAIADSAATITHQSRDITLPLLLTETSLPLLWRNYSALLNTLVQPGPRSLTINYDLTTTCFYRSCSVQSFVPDPECPFLQFNLTLTLIDGGAPIPAIEGIATHDYELILTHDQIPLHL